MFLIVYIFMLLIEVVFQLNYISIPGLSIEHFMARTAQDASFRDRCVHAIVIRDKRCCF